jgi:hypothetical protein
LSGTRAEAHSYSEDTANTFRRLEVLKRHAWVYESAAVILLGLWLAIVAKVPESDLFGQGFLLMFVAVNLSPYYYLTFALLPMMLWRSSRLVRRYAVWGTSALLVGHWVLFRGMYVSFNAKPLLLSKWVIFLFLLGLSAVSLFSCWRSGESVEARSALQ